MDSLIPRPDAIPVSWHVFRFLLLLTFPLHLLFMNSMLGTAGIALYARWSGGNVRTRMAGELGKILPFLVAFTINVGVAPLLFLQVLYGQFFYVSSILMAVFWLAVVPLLIAAYSAAYFHDFRFDSLGRFGTAVIGLTFCIFLLIAFLYTNDMTLMLAPGAWPAYFSNPAGTHLNFADPVLLPRYLHFVVGGTAVGGLFVAAWGKRKKTSDPELSGAAVDLGMGVFSWLTLAQILVGAWFLGALPRNVTSVLLGGSVPATAALLVALALALFAVVAGFRKRVGAAALSAVPLVYTMALVRDFVRTGYLAPAFHPEGFAVSPEYSPMLLFAATLVAGIAVVAWMLLRARSARTPENA